MTRDSYMVIDIGTGNVRVAITSTNGEIINIEREDINYETDVRNPDALFFSPVKLWEQVLSLMKNVLEPLSDVRILAITASSQREGIVLIDQQGAALIGFPNIDHRGRTFESEISNKSSIYNRTGRYPTSLFSAFKLLGYKHQYPEDYNRIKVVVSISDWVQYQLTGIARYEHSQASETLLYDISNKCWSKELCTIFGVDINILPALQSAGSVLSGIKSEFSKLLNLPDNVIIVVGGADTQLAIKSTQPTVDDVVIVAGTTTCITKITDTYITDVRERSWTNRHVEEGQFILETNAGVTGLNYQRLKNVFYPHENYDTIEEELKKLKAPESFASLGSVIANEKESITWGGFLFEVPVAQDLSRASFVQATLWDIACSVKENFDTLNEINPHTQDYIWACGGGFQSPTLLQYISSLLKKKIRKRKGFRQASVVGGAILCNEARNIENSVQDHFEVISPEKVDYSVPYSKWKNVREGFKVGRSKKESA